MEVDDNGADFVPFPLVRLAQGGRSPDGRALLVEASTSDGRLLRFAISLSDIRRYVSFVLVSACKVAEPAGAESAAPAADVEDAPIPVASIAVGELSGNDSRLEIAVGPTELTFAVPSAELERLARTMLTMSAQLNSKYKM